MSMSSIAAKIGTTLIALCFAVGLAGTASATPASHSHSDGEMAAPIYPGCYLGDGHSWH